MTDHQEVYDRLALEYDLMIDWKTRLEKELPFFLKLFEQYGVKTILDAGCSSGQHSIAFSQQGFKVTGCDLSSQMLNLARKKAINAKAKLEFVQAGLTELINKISQPVDAVICLGNTLPHLHSHQERTSFFEQANQLLNPGGILIIQTLNYTRNFKEQRRTHPIKQGTLNGKEFFFIRIFDYLTDRIVQGNFIILERFKDQWNLKVNSIKLKAIFKEELEEYLIETGFDKVNYWGNYQGTTWQEDSSDLIVTAIKPN